MKNTLKILTVATFVAALTAANIAVAGPGHDHSHMQRPHMTEQDAYAAARGAIDALIAQGYEIEGAPLEASWADAEQEETGIHDGGNYYIVDVQHPQNNSTLYLLFSKRGELYDANFTGKFEGLEE